MTTLMVTRTIIMSMATIMEATAHTITTTATITMARRIITGPITPGSSIAAPIRRDRRSPA